jgi:iron(III) transport system permease protein
MADFTLTRPHAGKITRRGARRAVWPLALAAAAVSVFVAVPLIYILLRAAGGGSEVWLRLLQTRLAGLFLNTLSLTVAVTFGTVVLGVSLAWLTERTNLPGRRLWRWLLAMPLAIPTYIGAVVHLALLRPRGGYIPQLLSMLAGRPVETPSPFGFWGAAFILTLFMYPYVYLLSAAAFRSIHASLEEASRSLGHGVPKTLWKVVLPVLRPGISAGALLVVLDILAEYGTVAMLRYETFSAAIFLQLSGRYDRSAAAVLSGVLIIFAVIVLFGELRLQGRARFEQFGGSWRPARPLALGRWTLPALMLVGSVVLASLIVPVTILLFWTWQALTAPTSLAASMQTGSQGIWTFAWNSLWSSGLAALLAVLLSLPVALLAVRYPSKMTRAVSRLCQVGYALPGVVVALSLILLVNRFLPFLYATPLLVVMAYVLRHMPQAVRSSEAALAQLSPTLEEAAHSLGRSPLKTFIQVTLRIILPGLIAGGALVFLTSLKELPATLLLRPAGFDTLAVRVWIWAGEGIYTQAAPAALLLILAAAGPLYFLLRQEKLYRE